MVVGFASMITACNATVTVRQPVQLKEWEYARLAFSTGSFVVSCDTMLPVATAGCVLSALSNWMRLL